MVKCQKARRLSEKEVTLSARATTGKRLFFPLGFNQNLIKENERGIAELEDTCTSRENFVFKSANLSSLVDDIDRNALVFLVDRKHENLESISLLEKFLEEKNLEKIHIT